MRYDTDDGEQQKRTKTTTALWTTMAFGGQARTVDYIPYPKLGL
jgi:hypothetical protein